MRLGRYTLVRRVGSGGMAEVWKAKVTGPAGFEKILAIKRILPHRLTEQEYIDLFIDEAKLVAQLQHPNIVQVFDFGVVTPDEAWESETEYYMAMEYVAGQNVRAISNRLRERNTKWPLELTLFVIMETAKALAYAHGGPDATEGGAVVHRDVSPHNVLVSYAGRVKVTDFGIARVTNVLPRTADGIRRGKISYMSPEQIDLRPLDGRSDIFSLGAVLYEMLTGDKLFFGDDKAQIAQKIRNFELEALPGIDQIPGDIRYVLKKSLHLDPEQRFQDAFDMEAELRNILGTTGVQEAPVALSSLSRTLFEDEYRMETVHDEFALSEPTNVTTAPPLSDNSQSQTLPESAANIVIQKPAELAEERRGGTAVGPPPPPRPTSPALRFALLGVAAVGLIGLGALFARMFPSGASTTPAPTTAVAKHTPKRTPINTPKNTAAPIRTPVVRPPTRPPTRLPTRVRAKPTPTPVAVVQFGTLSVAARPWAAIYVNGEKVADETPLRRFPLRAGEHTIEARGPRNVRLRKRVTIKANVELKLFVDIRKKTIRAQ